MVTINPLNTVSADSSIVYPKKDSSDSGPRVDITYVEGKPVQGYYVVPTREAIFKQIVNEVYDKQWDPRNFQITVDVREKLWDRLKSLKDEEAIKIANEAFPDSNIETLTSALKEALVNKWFWALKVITNHAASAEQLAVSPLALMVDEFKTTPTIQHAATTFLRDEAMHGELFRYFLDKNLGSTVVISQQQKNDFDNLEYLTYLTKEGTLFLALAIEVIGSSFFEFFAEHSPDPLLGKICKQIAYVDERRHILFCQNLYNEFREWGSKPGSRTSNKRWERFRNRQLMKRVAQEIYKTQTDPNQPFMQAVRSLGIDPKQLLSYTFKRLKEELAKIDFEFDPNIIPSITKHYDGRF